MNIVFAGTPAFALPTLQRLYATGQHIVAVYTQPDRPAGRGRQLRASPIKEFALAHGIPVRQPITLREGEGELAALKPDVMVVVAYGLLLPPKILAVPRFGCINVHASLLPRWRGAAPIARAIEAGDQKTGVTIMQMEAGLDTGPMLLTRETAIAETDTSESLEQHLAVLGAEALLEALARVADGSIRPEPQDNAVATYAAKLQKAEALLDWSQPAAVLHRKIRAFNPRPVATTLWRGEALRLWEVGPCEPAPKNAAPGTVHSADASGLRVHTGDGMLNVLRLQAAGGRALPVREFLNGNPIAADERLGA